MTATLTPVEEAIAHLLGKAPVITATEALPLTESYGRILARDYQAPADVPPADNSAVDGYALRAEDYVPGQALPLSDRIPAGSAPSPLKPGTAARIFTGSEVPAGADTVVMQERVEVADDGILINADIKADQNIRRRGQDLAKGSLALAKGTKVRAQEMGLLASMGLAEVTLVRKLRVAILSTGDELVDPGNPLEAGQIYNTNRFTLLALAAEAGCEVVLCETLRDNRTITRETLERAAAQADLIITSGGVSVGEEDHVRAVLEESGELSLWRLAIKPGKPLAFGSIKGTPVLGLPGNPATVLVTFLVVGMPYIRTCQGRLRTYPVGQQVPAAFNVTSPSIRREFVRARLESVEGKTQVNAYPNQSSGVLSSACWADGLAIVPEHSTVAAGDLLTYYPFTELLS
ncbi:gephyrin-like molybdotransferase Glp [Marinobacter sp. 1_MG-2023]|uniref:molybdopterin molybdotransferase MoeA n=1 Tax=Marinobacter sp. 1_MG-2023 TaxID=3062627 RepID=UPI0026E2B731|nr:gephyrin-like molybdotransferase Glp [Marinobacter sp. 1_MG-2023]MDO6824104.1 molybdopterin molybdotransferase MoeA [Marinobacter sp. 1_MG-2023]